MDLVKLNAIVTARDRSGLFSQAYDILMLVCILLSIIPLMFNRELPVFKLLEIVTVSVFILDYVARWITAPFRSHHPKWVARLLYPVQPMAIIDLLSIIPVFNLINGSFKLFRMTRLFRLARLFKALRYSNKIALLVRVLHKEQRVLISVLMLALAYIFVTAIIMYNVEPHENSSTGEMLFTNFFDALYWAAVTLTQVGYGDLCPVTVAGRLVSIVSSLFGVAIIALPSGVITASYLDELRKEREEKAAATRKLDIPSVPVDDNNS